MKVLILVQSTDNSLYQPLIKAQMETWDAIEHPNIKVVYYRPNLQHEVLEGNILKVSHNKRGDHAFFVLMKSLRYLRNENWDYIIKTDNSVYVDKEEVYKLLLTKPREQYFGGFPITYNNLTEESKKRFTKNIKFLWGEFFVLSRDMAMHLVNTFNKAPLRGVGSDDIVVSAILAGFCPRDESLKVTLDENDLTGYAYRVRKAQLEYSPLFFQNEELKDIIQSDIQIMNHIHTIKNGKTNNEQLIYEQA